MVLWASQANAIPVCVNTSFVSLYRYLFVDLILDSIIHTITSKSLREDKRGTKRMASLSKKYQQTLYICNKLSCEPVDETSFNAVKEEDLKTAAPTVKRYDGIFNYSCIIIMQSYT